MSDSSELFVWLDRDPMAFDPDHSIEDIPGTADIDLLTQAILNGTFGDILPSRIHLSTQRQPASARSIRTIDIGRLLRDLGIHHRRCYQIELSPDSKQP